jgi:putative membrane protein
MRFYLFMILGLSAATVVFVSQNVAVVDVNFLVWTVSMSRALLILFTLAIGFLLGWFLHAYFSYRRTKPAATRRDLA